MVRTKVQCDFDIHHRVTGQHARGHCFVNAFLDRWNVLARNHAALDGVDKLNAFTRFVRFNLENHVAVLTLAAGLTDKLALSVFDRLANGFTISHLRFTHVSFHAKLALHAVNNDFQMQLAHPGDQGLAGFLIRFDAERRILLRQTLQGNAHFFLINLGLGFYRLRNHRFREYHAPVSYTHLRAHETDSYLVC